MTQSCFKCACQWDDHGRPLQHPELEEALVVFQLVATTINVFTFQPSLSGRGSNRIAHNSLFDQSFIEILHTENKNLLHCRIGPCDMAYFLHKLFQPTMMLFSFSCYCVASGLAQGKTHAQCQYKPCATKIF